MSQQKPTINTNAPIESGKQAIQTGVQEAINAVQQGVPPSNTQMKDAIDTTTSFLENKTSELPPQAAKAVGDIARVLEDTKNFLEEKNPDESLQKMYVHGTKAASELGAEASKEMGNASGVASERQGQAKEVFNAATSAAREIARSGEFRNLLLDLIDIFETSFWRVEREAENAQGPCLKDALKKDISQAQAKGESNLDNTQQAAKDLATRIKYTLKDESSLTPDERRLLRERFSNVLLRLKHNPQFNHAVQGLLSLFRYLRQEMIDSINKVENVETYNFNRMTKEAQKFLERFTSGNTLHNFSKSFRGFVESIVNDKELDSLIDQWKYMLEESLENPQNLVNNQQFIKKCDEITKKTRTYLSKTYNNNTYLQGITTEGKNILNAIIDDPLSNRLANDTKIMVQNFFSVDANNRPTINFELIGQMKGLLVPLLTEHLRWVPLPLIEGSNETYDYWFDNVVFSAPDLLPDQVHIRMVSEGDFDVKDLQTENFQTLVRFSAHGIRTTLKDIEFWFRRKTFPTTEDHGHATIELIGEGATVDIILGVSSGEHPFTVKRASVTLDSMKLTVADTRHDIFYNTIVAVFGALIKSKIEAQIQDGLRNLAFSVNNQLNRIMYETYQEASSAIQTSTMAQINAK